MGRPRIVVDHRERRSVVFRDLGNYDAELEISELDIGDYLVSDRAVVERKSMDDFCSSITDGRLFQQAKKLREYDRPVVVVENGKPRLPKAVVLGAISSLILDFNIPVVILSKENVAQFIYRLARREQESGRTPAPRRSKPKSLMEQQIYFLSGLPLVSTEMAMRILKEFGSPMSFFNSSDEEKLKVKGMGIKRIKTISRIINSRVLRGDEDGKN